jgi:uncharacterized protein YgiM (DUF1202 family)
MLRKVTPLIVLLTVLLCSCNDQPGKARAIGEAFAGPLNLNIRQEITPNSKVVATLHHGDHVDIIQVKRRFVKIRTKQGVEGWTDQRQLMSADQMKELQDFAVAASRLPAQGKATVYATLNIHSEPNRFSPAVYQIAEGVPVEVISHKVAGRLAQPPPDSKRSPLIKPPEPRAKKKKDKDKEKALRPPEPPAPTAPANWLELSKMGRADSDNDGIVDDKEEKPTEPVRLEDWTLVRTKEGKAGWVLTRMLTMSIPDEVAQYAEGKRITSYFSLGTVHDDELNVDKHNWLWTTRHEEPAPYQFDSFRVFFWNRKKHRYETYYIEKGVEGYFPVEAKPGPAPVFSVIVRDDDDGKLYKKTFTFVGYKFFLTSKTPYTMPAEPEHAKGIQIAQNTTPEPETKPSFTDRLRRLAARFKSQ